MAGSQIEPMPVQSPVIDPQTLRMTGPWETWLLLSLLVRIQQSSPVVGSIALLTQAAAIGVTSLIPLANAALYRVNVYAQVTQAATVSSSLNVSVLSTYKGAAITQTLVAATGNTVGTILVGSFLVRSDAGQILSFTAAYASVGATPMQFDLFAEAEAL